MIKENMSFLAGVRAGLFTVPGAGDNVTIGTKSARHQWGHRAWDSSPALGFGPSSPKVPGTNGDAKAETRRRPFWATSFFASPKMGWKNN